MCVCGVLAFCFELMVAAAKQRVCELLEDQTQKRFVLNPEAMCTHTHTRARTRTRALSYAFTDLSATIRKL